MGALVSLRERSARNPITMWRLILSFLNTYHVGFICSLSQSPYFSSYCPLREDTRADKTVRRSRSSLRLFKEANYGGLMKKNTVWPDPKKKKKKLVKTFKSHRGNSLASTMQADEYLNCHPSWKTATFLSALVILLNHLLLNSVVKGPMCKIWQNLCLFLIWLKAEYAASKYFHEYAHLQYTSIVFYILFFIWFSFLYRTCINIFMHPLHTYMYLYQPFVHVCACMYL